MRCKIAALMVLISLGLLAGCNREPAIPPHGTYATLLQAAEAADLYGALDNLKKGADIYERNAAGLTPLLVAVEKNQPHLAEALFQAGAPPDQADFLGNNALHLAAAANNLYLLEYLPSRQVPVNARNQENLTPLHVAALKNFPQGCATLLKAGADPHAMAEKENALSIPLYCAAKRQNWEVVRVLEQAGTLYSIFSAAAWGDLEGVKRKIEEEPGRFNELEASECGFGYTPIQYALMYNRIEMAEYLRGLGAEYHEVDNDGFPLIFYNADKGYVEALRFAVSCGADINLRTPRSLECSVLHHVATRDIEPKVWDTLFELGADPNLANGEGEFPLHLAVQARKKENVRQLLSHGADRNRLNAEGKTALQLAMEKDLAEIVQLLSETPTLPPPASAS